MPPRAADRRSRSLSLSPCAGPPPSIYDLQTQMAQEMTEELKAEFRAEKNSNRPQLISEAPDPLRLHTQMAFELTEEFRTECAKSRLAQDRNEVRARGASKAKSKSSAGGQAHEYEPEGSQVSARAASRAKNRSSPGGQASEYKSEGPQAPQMAAASASEGLQEETVWQTLFPMLEESAPPPSAGTRSTSRAKGSSSAGGQAREYGSAWSSEGSKASASRSSRGARRASRAKSKSSAGGKAHELGSERSQAASSSTTSDNTDPVFKLTPHARTLVESDAFTPVVSNEPHAPAQRAAARASSFGAIFGRLSGAFHGRGAPKVQPSGGPLVAKEAPPRGGKAAW